MDFADKAALSSESSANPAATLMEDGEINEEVRAPIFEVVFSNESNYHKYSEAIVRVLKEHLIFDGKQLNFSTTSGTDDVPEKCAARIQAFAIDEEKDEDVEKENVIIIDDEGCDENSNDSQDFGVDLNKLFTIDPSPSTSLESAKVPSYKRAIKEFLDEKVEEKVKNPDEACPRPKSKPSCFNCGSFDHGLRDCPLPRSAKRINRAKKARSGKGERYHVDVDQRFAHLRPGTISEKLQKALRLRHGEIPSFFYRMRVYGYPPGWLEDAKVSDSGITMFNSGDDVLKCEENESQSDIKYDISKIIEFPGFNISPGSNFYDDYKHFNVPPISRSQMKEEMIRALGDSAIKGFKRRKLKDEANENTQLSTSENAIVAEQHDMEIEDFDVTLPENVEIKFTRPLPPPLPPVGEENDLPPLPPASNSPSPPVSPSNEERSNSPTLAELQERQRALLLKLESGDDFPTDDELQTDISNSANNSPAPETIAATPQTPSTPVPSVEDVKKIIKSSHMGTPVLQFSPFEKLPSGENFKVGVSDVINFENLPDSTGKYESMKDVLKKVRNIKQQLDAEDD